MGQGGNAWEWNETAWDGTNNTADETRELRGGSWFSDRAQLDSRIHYFSGDFNFFYPSDVYYSLGFRVAMIPGKESMTLYLYTAADQTKGGLSVNPSQSSYISGDLVAVSASPLPGYLFSNWSGDISGTTASVTLTMNSNKNITANFGEDTRDSDADGLSNYQEIIIYGTNPNQKDTNSDSIEDGQAVALGYSPTFNFSALISHLQSHPPTGLYTTSQIQDMSMGGLVLTKNGNGFTLNYSIEKSNDLGAWTQYQSFTLPLSGLSPDKAFVRLKMANSSSGSSSQAADQAAAEAAARAALEAARAALYQAEQAQREAILNDAQANLAAAQANLAAAQAAGDPAAQAAALANLEAALANLAIAQASAQVPPSATPVGSNL
jgi:hypothetical protein